MTRQVERQLNARRELCKALIDADLEEEHAILMPQHDAGGDGRISRAQGHDLALADGGQRGGGVPDKTGVAGVLHQRRAARAFPAAGFQRQKILDRGADLVRRARDLEMHGAVFGEAMALTAQFLEFLGP